MENGNIVSGALLMGAGYWYVDTPDADGSRASSDVVAASSDD